MAAKYMIETGAYGKRPYPSIFKKDGEEYTIWNYKKKEWVPSSNGYGYFVGFEDGRPIEEDEVKDIIEKNQD